MSDDEKEHGDDIQVLLPGAKVKLFSRNKDTVETFLSLEKDWRFARVELEVENGDAETAATLFAREASPDLVIIETDNIDDDFIDELERLAGRCAENTSAIVVGPVNDVNLYRKLVGMGVSDYIVRPVKTVSFGNDIAATLLEQIGARDSRLIAVIGSKGGVGATTISEMLSIGLSERLGQKTFLMDTSGGWSSLNVVMDFEPATTLAEAIKASENEDENVFNRMLFEYNSKLTILTSGMDVMLDNNVEPSELEAMLDGVMTSYPAVVVDLSASSADVRRTVLTRASEIIIVTTPTVPALRSARTLMQEVIDLRGGHEDEIDLVVNMQGISSKHEIPKADITAALEKTPSAIIPFNTDLFVGIESQDIKFSSDKTSSDIISKLIPLASRAISADGGALAASELSADNDKKGGLEKFLQKLKVKE